MPTTDTIFSFSSLLVSFIALWHTYAVNKSFAKNQLIIDQVRSVKDLIVYLNAKKIEIKFQQISDNGSSRGGLSGELTLFELLEASDVNNFDDSPVLLDSNKCNEVFEFLKFINDPLMPAPIVKELSKFITGSSFRLQTYQEHEGQNIVVVQSGVRYAYNMFQYKEDDLRDKLIIGNAIALKSWLSMKTCCRSLKREIDKWFKGRSIDNLNIRTEFQSY